jgi:hypothetical protein
MKEIVDNMWRTQNRGVDYGHVIMGLGLLKKLDELWLIREDHEPLKIKTEDLTLDFEGIKVGEEIYFKFEDMEEWGSYLSQPCVSWEIAYKKIMFAPAKASDIESVVMEMDSFLEKRWDDNIYVSDIARPLTAIEGHEDKIFATLHPETNKLGPESKVTIEGHEIVLKEVTWIEDEEDGDSNRFLHVVLENGTYRRICFGDLGR